MEILLSLIIQLSIAFGNGGDVDFNNMTQDQQMEYILNEVNMDDIS